jgi:3-oxoacyl-[acyl-carrier-protein] synthase II
MGSLSPLGSTVAENWDNAVNGRSGIAPITRFDVSLFATRIAGELKNFDPVTYIEPKEVKKLDLFSQFALGASEEAWQSAKLENHPYDPSMMGCILGIGVGGLGTLEKYHGAYMEGGPRKISPFLIPAMISNLGPGNLGIKYGLKGINYAITSACTSATHALGEAYRMIADGLQDLIVAGGTEAAITPIGIGGFCSMKAMSTRNEEPLKASRPFDKDRDGFVMGEGSTILVLEALESAEKRGATILAEISGYGFSCDAYHITSPSPDGQGAVQCMSMALRSAKLAPEQVQYVNAHGTSTEFNDASETAGIKKVFGSWATNGLVVSSTKSMTGHLLGAAGAIEALLCVKAIQQEMVPPTINLDNPGEGCDLDYVPHTARPLKIQHAISNSFGFGGTNATVVISRAS